MKRKAGGEEGNKGIEATKQECMSKMQTRPMSMGLPWGEGKCSSEGAQSCKAKKKGISKCALSIVTLPGRLPNIGSLVLNSMIFFFQEKDTHKNLLNTSMALIKMPRGKKLGKSLFRFFSLVVKVTHVYCRKYNYIRKNKYSMQSHDSTITGALLYFLPCGFF